MAADRFVAVVGARVLPEACVPQVAEVVRFFLSRGWGLGSGGARGADAFALAAVVGAGRSACARSVVFLPGALAGSRSGALCAFAARGGRAVAGAGVGRGALLARSRRLARASAGVVAFLWGLSRGSVFTVREAIQAGKPAAVVLAGGGAVLPVFVGGAWVPCSIGPVAAFRWVARPGEARPARRGWLARVFQVPDGEPTHALLSHISALGPGERLWFERGVLAGDSVLVAHEALSDTPAFLATPRLMRRFRCSPREAAGFAELFLALDAGAAVVAHYAVEAGRRGAAAVIEDLAHLVARLALSEQVPDTDALVIRQLVAEMVTAGRSRDLIRNVVAPIRGTFNEAIEAGLRLPNPAARIGRFLRDRGDLRRRTDPLTGEEEALVLAAAREHYPRHFPMLLCALRTGMRLGELLGLQWGTSTSRVASSRYAGAWSRAGGSSCRRTGRSAAWTSRWSWRRRSSGFACSARKKRWPGAGSSSPTGSSATRRAAPSGSRTSSDASSTRRSSGRSSGGSASTISGTLSPRG